MARISELLFVLLTEAYFSSVDSIPIDNGVKEYPHVTCGPHSVQVDVNTLKPFNGRVYVKGEAHNKDCVRAFRGGEIGYGGNLVHRADGTPYTGVDPHYGGQTVGLELNFGQCNMKRQRTLYPRGVEYTFTMVVSFHPLFLTKVDRAYRIRCFYMEAEKTVQTNLDVSMLTTLQVNEQFPMPQCYYKLRRGGYDGPYVRFAKVGDKVVHVWECDKVAGYVYGILVKNCYVDDGQGNKVELINDKGCATDGHLVPDLIYDEHLISAYVETHVFKYADKPHLQFTCTVQLCFKNDGGCQGITPPNCGYGPLVGHSPQIPHGPLLPPEQQTGTGPLIPVHSLPNQGHHIPHPVAQPNGGLIPPGPPSGPVQEIPPPGDYGAPPQQGQGQLIHLPVPQVPQPDHFQGQFGSPPFAGGPPFVGGPPVGHHGLPPALGRAQEFGQGVFPPYKDDPIKLEKNDSKSKSKRSIKEDISKLLETDVSTEPILVLPFEELTEDDENKLNQIDQVSQEQRFKILKRQEEALHGICMTSSGFGILVSLFIAMFLFASTLTVLITRRQWSSDGGKMSI